MKKRILSVVFAAFMLSVCAFGFAACDLAAGTQTDGTQQSGTGDNTQDEGTQPGGGETDDPQGGEPAVRTTVTEEEWNAALRMDGVRNVTMQATMGVNEIKIFDMSYYIDDLNWYIEGSGAAGEVEVCGYIEILEIMHSYRKAAVADGSSSDWDDYNTVIVSMDNYYFGQWVFYSYSRGSEGKWNKELSEAPWSTIHAPRLLGLFLGCVKMPWKEFQYNESTAQYEIEKASFESVDGAQMPTDFETLNMKFENGKLICYQASFRDPSYPEEIQSVKLSFTDYGTTSVTLPEVAAE